MIVNVENIDCFLGWLLVFGDVLVVLESGVFDIDEVCGISLDLLDDEGYIVNFLLGEIFNLFINIRLNFVLGSILLSELDCEFVLVLN